MASICDQLNRHIQFRAVYRLSRRLRTEVRDLVPTDLELELATQFTTNISLIYQYVWQYNI